MKVTIFTPTYNRAKNLKKLYKSLIRQNNKNFKWIIVDDGSTDNTFEVVKNFKQEKLVEIIYYKQENLGKHIAHNKGVEMCDTELFFCVDSDDYLTENAIKVILDNIEENKESIGIVALKGYSKNNVMGNFMPKKIKSSTLSDLYNIYGKKGETALIFKTRYLKENYFPRFNNEKFLSEEILYNKLDDIGYLSVVNEIIYIMEYLDDGMTKNYIKLWRNSPNGVLELLNSRYIKATKIKGIKKYYRCIRVILVLNAFCIDRNLSIFKNTPNKFLTSLLFIPSFLVKLVKFN